MADPATHGRVFVELKQIFKVNYPLSSWNDLSTVVPDENGVNGLFVSAYEVPYEHSLLRQMKIARVLNVGGRHNFGGMPEPYSLPDGVEYLYLDVEDDEDFPITSVFDTAFKFLSCGLSGTGTPQNTLVHCQAGMSRSVTIVIAYLVAVRGMKLLDAARLVKKGRSLAQPNDGFLLQLINFAASLGRLE